MFKIAITGKGGVGKSTFTALLCSSFQRAGFRVLAVDADPNANLASTLGFPHPEKIVPISEMKALIAERTGTKPDAMGMFFKLNPRVDDIPERFSTSHNGIRLLVMGAIKKAGTGCYCPENAFVRELVGHLLIDEKEVVILDMEAGIEHLSRGTSGDVDSIIIVVEPGKRSIETAERLIQMAKDIDIQRYFIIINKSRSEEDRVFVEHFLKKEDIIGVIPYSGKIAQSGREDHGVLFEDISSIDSIRDNLIERITHE